MAKIEAAPVRADDTPYARATTGFHEYWYPVCRSREISDKPRAFELLGIPVTIMRRSGRAYALYDVCPHRGTPLSVGYDEFPGTHSIVCRYHGWTFDVRDGRCLAALCEGPQTEIAGRARVRVFPIEERKGVIWIWMGKREPVPIEEDVPRLLLAPTAVVKVRHRLCYGNWRWHAENVAGGHAQLVHKDSIWHWFHPPVAYPTEIKPRYHEDCDGFGIITGYRYLESHRSADYPGLGQWPHISPFRAFVLKLLRRGSYRPVQGLSDSLLRLPGCYRVVHHPMQNAIYYEWWVPVDADHYVYFQVTTFHPHNFAERIWMEMKYWLWGLPFGATLFNNQDSEMVRYTTDYVKRHGWVHHSRLSRQDEFHRLWRTMCNESARDLGAQAAGGDNAA